jgi:lysophospholipase L1-like esterase
MIFFKDAFAGGREKSEQLAKDYAAVAQMEGVGFLNAGSVIRMDGVDGLHLSAAAEQALGKAVADKVEEMLQQGVEEAQCWCINRPIH